MKQKDLLFLLISSAVLAGIWIIFTILHNTLTSTISSTLNEQITPITGSFDTKTIQALQKRQQIKPEFVIQGTDQLTLTPTPTPTLAPVPALSPIQVQLSGSSSASSEGTPTP